MSNTQQVADARGAKEQQKSRVANATFSHLKVWDEQEQNELMPSEFLLQVFLLALKSEDYHELTAEVQREFVDRFNRLNDYLVNVEMLYKERI